MGLYEKIYKVMEESTALEKKMDVGSGSYQYKAISEASVLNLVKPLLKKHKLILIPIEVEVNEIEDRKMTQLKAKYKIIDVETGESEILATVGNGSDSQDKGSGKAWTYAYKVLLQKTFMLFSGEDTDNEHSDDIAKRNAKAEAEEKEMKASVKQVTLQDLLTLAESKKVTNEQLLAKVNNATPEKDHVTDVQKLTEQQIIGLYKLLGKVK